MPFHQNLYHYNLLDYTDTLFYFHCCLKIEHHHDFLSKYVQSQNPLASTNSMGFLLALPFTLWLSLETFRILSIGQHLLTAPQSLLGLVHNCLHILSQTVPILRIFSYMVVNVLYCKLMQCRVTATSIESDIVQPTIQDVRLLHKIHFY